MMVEKLQNGLSRLSETDELTGVANRRAFYRLLTLEEQRALASNTTFSVIVTDLDQFKAINDTYGHAQGDRVLIEFSRLVADTVGPRDLVARLGGDEFGIVLPSAERVEALELVNQIRGSLEKMRLSWQDK
ncbi:GGDEF domain-containing protein [Ochrobactrum pseudogrignonense]|nr:GGDEF domain-containing protein [Brucella pseudogrignonensis]